MTITQSILHRFGCFLVCFDVKPAGSWVQVAMGTGVGTARDTRGLPVPFPTYHTTHTPILKVMGFGHHKVFQAFESAPLAGIGV